MMEIFERKITYSRTDLLLATWNINAKCVFVDTDVCFIPIEDFYKVQSIIIS